jgi:WD40 repeat protein
MTATVTPPTPQQITTANASGASAGGLRLLQTLPIPGFSPGRLSQCSVAFSSGGRLLAGVCYNNTAPVWEVPSGRLLFELLAEPEQLTAVSFSPDSRRLATGSYSGQVRLYDTATGGLLSELPALRSAVWELDFNPAGDRLAAASIASGVQVWQQPGGASLWSYGDKQRLRVLSLAYAPDGKTIACGMLSGGVVLLDAQNGDVVSTLPVDTHVGDVSFSPDGSLLSAGSDDNLIRIWRTLDYKLLQTLHGHSGFVNGVAFSPDGALLASGSHDKTVGVWEVSSGRRLATLAGHEDTVLRLAFNPQGTLIASVSWDGTVRLWGIEQINP